MRRDQQAGRIPVPPVEILEILDQHTGEPALLSPPGGAGASKPRRVLAQLVAKLVDRRTSEFLLDPTQIPTDILHGRRDFALLAFDAEDRPVLQVLPGMTGELRIGVSRMTVAQMLADPALQIPHGGARLPLPYGARLRIHCGPKLFVARVGGPPLTQTPMLSSASESASARAQLAHA